jgi:hypothetical protein
MIKSQIDIKLMFFIIKTIDQSYYLNVLFKNKFEDLYLVLLNFIITMIY